MPRPGRSSQAPAVPMWSAAAALARISHGEPDARTSYARARPGDIVAVRIGDLHPTQPALGHGEIHYKLGRYVLGKDDLNKRFHDWCKVSGLLEAAWAAPGARLDDPATFGGVVQPGAETTESLSLMKTVVIGPGGRPYLTDGHHTLSALRAAPDGGPDTWVRLRVLDNLGDLSPERFWERMREHRWVWLEDAEARAVAPEDLPTTLSPGAFGDDRYRSLLYFARGIGYSAKGSIPFQEFYWGAWLRETRPDLATWDATDLDAYLAEVEAVTRAQIALPAGAPVYGGYTKEDLGAFDTWDPEGEFTKLSRPFSERKPGKLAYALEYLRLRPRVPAAR